MESANERCHLLTATIFTKHSVKQIESALGGESHHQPENTRKIVAHLQLMVQIKQKSKQSCTSMTAFHFLTI